VSEGNQRCVRRCRKGSAAKGHDHMLELRKLFDRELSAESRMVTAANQNVALVEEMRAAKAAPGRDR
jgi:hypothetical protein